MDGFLAGHELSLFLCLYAGADEDTHVQGLHGCLGLHKGLAGRCRGTWCAGPVPRLRAADRAKGTRQQRWGRQRQPSGRKSYVYLLKKATGHKKIRLKNCPGKLKSPYVPTAAPRQVEELSFARRQRWPLGFSSPFFPVGKSPASARVVSKPHTMRHPQG